MSTLKALELMRKDEGGKGGVIMNVSSIAAFFVHSLLPIYHGTKSYVLQFSNCLGLPDYYDRTGVKVIAMCFGVTDTSLLSKEKLGNFDKVIDNSMIDILQKHRFRNLLTWAELTNNIEDRFTVGQTDKNSQSMTETSQQCLKVKCIRSGRVGVFENDTTRHSEMLKWVDSAAHGVIDALQSGESGSTWLSIADKPARDVTDVVKKGYGVLSSLVFE